MIYPFINFQGTAGQAIAFYEKVFNCNDKRVMHYSDAPPNPSFIVPDEMKNYILHAEMTICGTRVNFSDTQENISIGGNITLALEYETPDEVLKIFNSLKEGGEVLMDCKPQFFSPMYAWVVDKFGTSWQIICRQS